MDGREGRRVRLYNQDAVDKTIANMIMLRYRPIAPRPPAGDPNHEAYQIENRNKNKLLNQRRSKRKYVKVRENNRKKKITVHNHERGYNGGGNDNNKVTTLQLFPERSDCLEDQQSTCRKSGSWLSFGANNFVHLQEINIQDKTEPLISLLTSRVLMDSDQTPENISPEKSVSVEEEQSWVTVESVTDTCMDVKGLGCTDAERIINLEADRCPGFISDGHQVVWWVNEAYKRMVTMRGRNHVVPDHVVVRLVMKDRLPCDILQCKAFTCRIRLKDAWQKEKMVPCDVWRMDGGGFAWRLDVEAALSLGR